MHFLIFYFQTEHDSTALVWEWLPIAVQLTNGEESLVSDVLVSFGLDSSSHSNLEHASKTQKILFGTSCNTKGVASSLLPFIGCGMGRNVFFAHFVKVVWFFFLFFFISLSFSRVLRSKLNLSAPEQVCGYVMDKTRFL